MTGLVSVAAIFVLGIGAQWIAWRYRVPSILLLLVLGFVAGPVAGLLDPAVLGGDWVFTFVGVSVGIILFEGGLSLRLDDLRDVGGAVFRLITAGVGVTWLLASLAAFFLLDLGPAISILLGAILTVTGPTVILPLLRHIRPKGRSSTVAKWEGIIIDPIGAILAVLVLETIILMQDPGAGTFSGLVTHALKGLMLELFIGVSVGIGGAAVFILLLRRRMVPDFLQNPTALMVVIAVFAVSDVLQPESGLVATTIMGLAVANQRYVSVRRIVEFKEDLRVLLISVLFIVLAARLQLSHLDYIGWEAIIFLIVLMVVVRPAAVFMSTFGTRLRSREKVFLSLLAPRGIVAAAVASLFTFRLAETYPAQSDALVPIVFLVIVGTVAIYGLTAAPVARWLGLADPDPQGILFVGAHGWARNIAKVLDEADFDVLLVDSNPSNVRQAHREGLNAEHANILSEAIMDELDLSGIGRLVALTPNDEVNSLAVLHFTQMFDSSEVYQLATREEQRGGPADENLAQHLRGRPLFGRGTNYTSLCERFDAGAEVRVFELSNSYTYDDVKEEYGGRLTPLFVVQSRQRLHVVSEEESFARPEADQLLIAIVDSATKDVDRPEPEAITDVAAT